jgi:hypothetical protein
MSWQAQRSQVQSWPRSAASSVLHSLTLRQRSLPSLPVCETYPDPHTHSYPLNVLMHLVLPCLRPGAARQALHYTCCNVVRLLHVLRPFAIAA